MIKILYEDRKIIEEMYNSQMPAQQDCSQNQCGQKYTLQRTEKRRCNETI